MTSNRWDTSYEWKAVTLLALGFGLVGLDRWLIAPLFPAMMKDLHLTAQDVGNCIGILGLSWGVFAALMGGISDKIGRRKVLIPAIIAFSLLSGFSGVAGGLASLLAVRSLMARSVRRVSPRPPTPRIRSGAASISGCSKADSRSSGLRFRRSSRRNCSTSCRGAGCSRSCPFPA
jgi:MFS family permease